MLRLVASALVLALPLSVLAQTSPTDSPASETIFDGRRSIAIARIDDSHLRWDGVVVRYDEHVLLWLDSPATPLPDGIEVASRTSPRLGLFRVRAAGEDGLTLARRLAHLPGVRAAIPDIRIPHTFHQVAIPPNDPLYGGQWFYERLDMESAWELSTGSPDVNIVVVDNGCDLTHPDLVDHLDPGRDVLDEDDDPSFEPGVLSNEHGTACAGLVAASTDNGVGVAGACPECRLRCVRLLGEDDAPLSGDVAAFEFALEVEAEIVSNSWGFTEAITVPGPLEAIIERVVDEGRGGLGGLVVFAAGNDARVIGQNELGAVRGIINVGATNNFDEATSFSNSGLSLDIVSPTGSRTADIAGADGADPGDYTSSFGGTSSAAPIVSGVVGLMIAADPEVTGEEIRAALDETATQSLFATPDERGHDLLYGWGRMEPAKALRRILDIPEPSMDAGVATMDAGTTPPDEDDGGCAAGGHSSVALLLLLGLIALRRRR